MHNDVERVWPLLTQMFEQTPNFMALLRGPEYRFDLANPGFRALVGRDVSGQTVTEAFSPDAAGRMLEILSQVQASGVAHVGKGTLFRRPGKSGGDRYIDYVCQPLRNTAGEIDAVFLEGSDVTDRVLGERALSDNEALYKSLFDGIDEGFCIIEFFDGPHGPDSDYIHILANDAYARNAGIPNVVGQKLREMVGEEADSWVARYGAVLATGKPIRFQQTLVETGRDLDLTAIRIEPASRKQVAVLFRDVTDRARAERALAALNETLEKQVHERTAELMAAEAALQQAQKMEAVGHLTGGLAHDFNNILAGISGSLEMLTTRVAQGRINEIDRYVTSAMAATKRASNLTQRLLAFSRRQTLDPRPVDVNSLVNGMLDLIGRTMGPHIRVESAGAAGLWTTIVDPAQLENALLNLCINARDAMPDGGHLTIETSNRWMDERSSRLRGLEPGQYVSLCVSDTGTGMSEETIARAFDPFFTTKPIGQGTGLGLSMVYGFAAQSGGAARIYSEVDKGSMICIYLPRHFGEGMPAEAVPDIRSEAPKAPRNATILLVDDEPLLRMVAAEQLEELGYAVIEAVDGPSALRVLDSDIKLSLLITDVGLPGGLNGRQVADAARARRPDLQVLFVTGYAENAVLRDGHLERGMSLMTKPFQLDTFAKRVKDLVDKAPDS